MVLLIVYKESSFPDTPNPFSSVVLSLLQDYHDVFPANIPAGRPPIRGMEHQIDLTPGAIIPNRPDYRYNPEETKELKRQVEDLLFRGYIRKSKLATRGTGPHRVLRRIKDNAYIIDLPIEYNVSNTFNVSDLSPFHAETGSRTNPFEEGGSDATTNKTEDEMDGTSQPHILEPTGAITRARARILQEEMGDLTIGLLGLGSPREQGGTMLTRIVAVEDPNSWKTAKEPEWPPRLHEGWLNSLH